MSRFHAANDACAVLEVIFAAYESESIPSKKLAREAEQLNREVRARELEVTRRDLRKRVHSAFATALYQAKAFPTQSQIAQSA